MIQKILLFIHSLFLKVLTVIFLVVAPTIFGQPKTGDVTRIHTDWKTYWTSNEPTTGTNRPDLDNNLIGFEWNGVTYSTGVDDATLITNVPSASIQKFRALKIQSLSYGSSTYFLQGAMIDGLLTNRILTPALATSGTSTAAEVASRLTDGKNGLSLGTGIANIGKTAVFFKVGVDNLNLSGLNDGIPDLIVTQVAQPGGADVFKFVDANGIRVGNEISIDFNDVTRVGSYSLDLFNAASGTIATSFSAQETRDIRILGYDTAAFGITTANASQVDGFVVSFSGSSDCAFIAFNANSLKKAELSLVKKIVSISGCGVAGDKINYSFKITNTGDTPITNINLTDPLPDLALTGTQGLSLAANSSSTIDFTGVYTITAADVTAGYVSNSAKVTGIDASLNTVEDVSGDDVNNDIVTVANLLKAPTGITGTATICKGDSTTLTVSGGNVGLGATVEWFIGSCGGTPAGTGNSIVISPLSNTTYWVRYKSTCNGVTTSCASRMVTVNTAPAITTQPSTPTATCSGSGIQTISVVSTGAGLTYSWRRAGVALVNSSIISGQGTATLTLANALVADAGSYDVVISGTCSPTVTSNAVTVTVNTAPAITTQPSTPTATCSGSGSQTISVVATGAGLTYSWRRAGVALVNSSIISGQGSATLTLTNALVANAGSYDVVVSGTCTPAMTSNAVTVTVNENSGNISLNGTSYPSNGNAIYCCSNLVTFSIPAVSGATYTWFVPAGWKTEAGVAITAPIVSSSSNELKVITGNTAGESGPVMVTIDAFCPSSLTVNLTSIAPPAITIAKTADPTCAIPTGTITATSLSGTLTYTLIKTSVIPEVTVAQNATGVFSGLAAGDYEVVYQVDSGCYSGRSNSVSIASYTNTWNGTALGWSKGSAPSTDDFVVFDADYNESLSVNACSCTVNSTADVTIASGKILNIVGDLDVQGTLTFANGASLIQDDPAAANIGVIKYNRTTSSIKNYDYVYWSSPVEGQTLGGFSPGSDRFYSRVGDDWDQRDAADVMETGHGYIARVPKNTNPQSVTFEGKPNNGDITVAVTSGNDNLVGNPYPSSIDADEFITDNLSRIKGMLSFWTHITKRKLNSAGNLYEYTVDDFAYYNSSGWVSPVSDEDLVLPDEGTIGAGQSFFVHSTAGNFVFNNGMRIAEDDKNGLFFKHANKKKRAKIEKNRVWLNLTNSDGAFRQLLVGYITGATNDLDNLYDGTTNGGNAVIDFYSIMNTNRFMIQGRGLPFDETDEVPLGYKSAIDGVFEISIAKRDGALASQAVYLEDKTANVVHDLIKGSYSFTTAKGEFTDRFVMRYTDTSKLGTGEFDSKGKGVIVSVKNSQIKVNSSDQTMQSVKVYDLKGSLVYQKDKINNNEFVIDQLNSSNQFMIVMVQLEDGKWVSEEIIFHD